MATIEHTKVIGVTDGNLAKVIAGFDTLKAGLATSTVEEIQTNVTTFVAE